MSMPHFVFSQLIRLEHAELRDETVAQKKYWHDEGVLLMLSFREADEQRPAQELYDGHGFVRRHRGVGSDGRSGTVS